MPFSDEGVMRLSAGAGTTSILMVNFAVAGWSDDRREDQDFYPASAALPGSNPLW